MISVIIPCYNAEAYLSQTLASVKRQSRPVDEIIVVDDCSTDNSVEIAKQHDVRLLSTPRNQGHAAARNLAISEARGEILAWVDADDYWDHEHIETVVGLLDHAPDAAVAFSAVRFVGSRKGDWSTERSDWGMQPVFWDCFRGTIVPAMACVTRKQSLLSVGCFDASIRIAPDFDLWLRMARRFPFTATPKVTSNYRWHDGQISATSEHQRKSIYQSRLRMVEQLQQEGELLLADQARLLMTKLWERDLKKAWYQNDRTDLVRVLDLAKLLGDQETRLSAMLRRRMLLPGWPNKHWSAISDFGRRVLKSPSAGD